MGPPARSPVPFHRFLFISGVRESLIKGAKVADFHRNSGQAVPWGVVGRTALLNGLFDTFCAQLFPIFVVIYYLTLPSWFACLMTRLTLRNARRKFPPSTLLSDGHAVSRAVAHCQSGIRSSLMLLTRYPFGMLLIRPDLRVRTLHGSRLLCFLSLP